MNDYAFLYTDYDYFVWFAQRTQDNLNNVLSWKRLRAGRRNINNIVNLWNEEHHRLNLNLPEVEELAVTSRAFLYHLNDPSNYPIFDSNVHRAMRKLNQYYLQKTPVGFNRNDDYTWEHYTDYYRDAFNNLYNEQQNQLVPVELPEINGIEQLDVELIKRRMLDRALWAYGIVLDRQNH